MLSNLETEKSKLLQIVLVGQPNLRDKLAAPELEQLRQRITVSNHLLPLDATETHNYINHRLQHAALGTPMVFPRDATALIHARSRGVPRIINVICDAALVFGYAEDRRTFDGTTNREVLQELEMTGVLPRSGPAPVPPPAAARPAPPPAMAVATMGTAVADARQDALERRERMLRQREVELAEQRRVLAEEYRLLRTRQVAATPPPIPVTFWSRVKRFMLGVSP